MTTLIPYIRQIPVEFKAHDLKPYSQCNFWFDDININNFIQPASVLSTNAGFLANTFVSDEAIYCHTSHAYARIIEHSQNHLLYLSENFTCVNVSPYGPVNSNTFTQGNYNVNDLVYLTANNQANVLANICIGTVVYWNPSDGVLALFVQGGTVNVGSVLIKVGATNLANITGIVQGNKFPVGASVQSVSNIGKIFTANGYLHQSGVVGVVTGNGSTIQVSGNVTPAVVNSNIYITNGGGIGQIIKINSISSNNILNLNGTVQGVIGNSMYGIGNVVVDDIGICAGIFQIPELNSFNFQTGARLFTINNGQTYNDTTATMLGTATFLASGKLSSSGTPTVNVTPQASAAAGTTTVSASPTSSDITNNSDNSNNPAASADPLVQTFFTPKPNTNKTDNGIFVTSIDLFFQNKPSGSSTQFPVSVYLVSTVNGFPTTQPLAVATTRWDDVAITDGFSTFPNPANNATLTKFSFPDPVYIAPGTEYGIVVYSESPDYEVWIAEIGQTIVNSNRLASSSPFIGKLYKSQNSSTWNPIPNQQLMFVVNKAQFSNQAVSLVFDLAPPAQNTFTDIAILHSSDFTFPVANITYGIKGIIANTGIADVNYLSVVPDAPFFFGSDLVNSSADSNRRRVIQAGVANSAQIQIIMDSSDPDITPMFHSEALNFVSVTNIVNNGGLTNNCITITSPGVHSNAANIKVTISAPTGDNGIQANAYVAANGLSGSNLVALTIDKMGSGYIVSPTITIAEPGVATNATAIFNGEDGIAGGNGLARYVTRQITLADGFDAGDLVVYLSAVRPQGTDVNVYYKVLSRQDTQPFTSVPWRIMSKAVDIFSPDQKTPISLTFNTGTNAIGPIGSVNYTYNGIQYPLGGKFANFAIKIVLTANDPTVPPEVQSMQAISVPAG
jgi:hypothetical protein